VVFMAKTKSVSDRGILKQTVPIWLILVSAAFLTVVFAASYLATSHLSSVTATSLPTTVQPKSQAGVAQNAINMSSIVTEVLPQQGFVLPAKWGDSVKRLVDSGALNISFLNSSASQAGQPLTADQKAILNGTSNESITINANDTVFLLLALWSLGINNNNTIITKGPIMSYGNPDEFASTGGYGPVGTLHIGGLDILRLNASEQAIANYTAMNSYRPCCNNPTGFPDCNHGAAALGLIELMASQGANSTAIFNALKEFNSFEFPQQYLDVAVYLQETGSSFNSVPASLIMSANMSSASAAGRIQSYISRHGANQQQADGGGACGA